MAEVVFTERAVERLEDLEPDVQERIKKKLKSIQDWPDHYLKPLSNEDEYRLRVGDYRVIIDWDKNDGVLTVRTLGHRRNIYDRR